MDALTPRIAVLMATYNGARNLDEQIESFATQTVPPTHVVVSDDGSTDGTVALIEAFARRHPAINVTILKGPGKGSALNFLHLMRNVPDGVDAVAISDQDDVWLPEKLARGFARLGGAGPVLYCAATWVCDLDLGSRRLSRCPRKPTGFRHALVQNVAGGNTMMMNMAAAGLLRDASVGVTRLIVHDWWMYQIVSGAGGRVVFDPEPVLLYRQHEGNLIGANDGFGAKLRRLRMLVGGTFREWNAVNVAALRLAEGGLTDDSRALLADFVMLRRSALPQRLRILRKTGLYRQDLAGNLSLWLAAVLGRI